MPCQVLDILDEAIGPPVPNPQRQRRQGTPQDEPEHQLDPEHDGTIGHVEDLEADEEHHEEREEGSDIGLGSDANQERGEVCLHDFEDAEGGRYDLYHGREDGGGQEVGKVG